MGRMIGQATAIDRRPAGRADLHPPGIGDGFTVQETAERTGLSEHNLRSYERAGLLEPIRRHDTSGHRRYSAADISPIATLACLRATGMPLDQMRRYFTLSGKGRAAAPELRALLEEQQEVLQDRRRPGLRAQGVRTAGPGRRGAAPLRRHHDLFTATALAGRARAASGNRGPRRAGSRGPQIRQGVRSGGGSLHYLSRQDRGRQAARRRRGDHLPERRRESRQANRFDFIIDTVAVPHDLGAYLRLLKRDGTLCLVGVPDHPHPSPDVFTLIGRRRSLAGSLIGGIRETQEMLDFCAEKGIVSDVEVIPIQQINTAYERMLKSDVKYRFVIDLKSLAQG